jgi:pentatricopeptide repeat protein
VLLMHGKCRMMIGAHRLFDEMLERNFFSWNTIIEGLLDSEDYLEAFQMFLIFWEEFSDGGSRTFAMIIQASAVLSNIFAGRQFH